jgi:malate dehydrogenase (quinone)
MLSLLEKVFADKVATPAWQDKIRQIVPSYGTQLNSDPKRVYEEWASTSEALQLPTPPQIDLAALSSAAQSSSAAEDKSEPAKRVHDLAP